MARIYADENFPLPAIARLRELGHDVLTVQESGKGEQRFSDAEVLLFATADGRTVLTLNRKHFLALHRDRPEHAGIIVCTVDVDFSGQADRIHAALAATPRLESQLLRVNRL